MNLIRPRLGVFLGKQNNWWVEILLVKHKSSPFISMCHGNSEKVFVSMYEFMCMFILLLWTRIQTDGGWAECLLLITGSVCFQQHLNTALCDTAWGYNRAVHASLAIFIQHQECTVWPELFDPDFLLEPNLINSYRPDCQRSRDSAQRFAVKWCLIRYISCSSLKWCACVIS